MRIRIAIILGLALAAATAGGDEPATQPAGDLDYWLGQAETVPASQPATGIVEPAHAARRFTRDDALPGVLELSNGTRIAGGVYTTRGRPWTVWVEAEKRWRRIPPAAVLRIRAVVKEERLELVWRWKGMGEPERVYTGESYPFRRFEWQFLLADGSMIAGAVKGQPVWVETRTKTAGPMLLHERSKGKKGQALADDIYIRQILISRRLMDAVRADQAKEETTGDEAGNSTATQASE